jgi:hypothetical protein
MRDYSHGDLFVFDCILDLLASAGAEELVTRKIIKDNHSPN